MRGIMDVEGDPPNMEELSKGTPSTSYTMFVKTEYELEQAEKSLVKEVWLDDVKVPCKAEEVGNGSTAEGGPSAFGHDEVGAFPKLEDTELEGVKLESHEVVVVGKTEQTENASMCHTGTPSDALACDSCDFTASNARGLIAHRRVHKPKPFSCGMCRYTTSYRLQLQNHLLDHAQKSSSSFSCEVCDYVTDNRSELEKHVLIHAGRICPNNQKDIADPRFPGFKCRLCGCTASAAGELEVHYMRCHQALSLEVPAKMKCELCNFESCSKAEVESHLKERHNTRCRLCSHRCASPAALAAHVKDFHKKKSSAFINLLKNKWQMSGKKYQYVFCELCGAQPSNKKRLEAHRQQFHRIQPPPPLLTGNGL